ncbi:hypothetical protein E0500_029965 [Streptomyces sp. KM273126]|uniref:hypothetical protein n=1 Tax=Streptomyces sp. KM273126 TaxID=2545247 RepID=UPI00103E3124|nr:hypothetical protein [Streptomyces sp. KM273126]MBA2811459.1 hypothetical protein [Streptomyces sp. KM273126]
MLANLLPGVRELRTPLTVGYLWLISIWLWFHDVLPQRTAAHGAIGDLFDLVGVLPSASFLAALTFIAYFLGSTVELDPATARWLDGIRPNRPAWEAVANRVRFRLDNPEDMPPERSVAAIAAWRRAAPSTTANRVTLLNVELVQADWQAPITEGGTGRTEEGRPNEERVRQWRHEETGPIFPSASYKSRRRLWRNNPGDETSGTLVEWRDPDLPISDATVRQMPVLAIAALLTLSDELPDLATRLLIQRPEVFDRYDRLLSEASIRINMFLPTVALVATLAVRAHVLWCLALTVCAVLLYQGLTQRSRAIAVVLDSIATQLIESPTMVAVAAALHGEAEGRAPYAKTGRQSESEASDVSPHEPVDR